MKKRSVHTKTILFSAMFFSAVPLIILVLILFSYTLRQNSQRETDIIKNAQTSVAKSLSNDIHTVEYAADMSSHQMDFLIFCNSSDRKKLYLRGTQIIQELSEQYAFHPSIAAVFLYNSSCDYLYPRYFYNAPKELRSLGTVPVDFTDGQEELQNNNVSAFNRNDINTTKNKSGFWDSCNINGDTYLYYQIQSDFGLLTIVMYPNRNYDFKNLASDTTKMDGWQFSDVPVTDQSMIVSQVPDVPLWILTPSPAFGRSSMGNIDTFQIIILCLIAAFITLIPLLWLWVHQLFLSPITRLDTLFEQIKKQDLASRVPVESNIIELRSFAENFNEMLDNIEALNKKLYEQRLTASRARLQFLQLQIRPHFYLNCLKNMYTQLLLGRYDKIGDMILALSNYFAQAFRDIQNFVSLKDELETCQSYIRLQNILERQITFELDIDSRCAMARCLPMTVVTFVENSIKHSPNDKSLSIRVVAGLTSGTRGGNMLLLTISNTGAFSHEALRQLNSADPSEMVYKHEKIGISNVRYRLWLIYRETACITFKNEGSFAVVHVLIPFEPL